MTAGLKESLISVWKQARLEEAKCITVENRTFRVRQTSRSKLREVDFEFEGKEFRGLEQNPATESRWKLAREEKKVMQFLKHGRYFAVVVDGKVKFYGKKAIESGCN